MFTIGTKARLCTDKTITGTVKGHAMYLEAGMATLSPGYIFEFDDPKHWGHMANGGVCSVIVVHAGNLEELDE